MFFLYYILTTTLFEREREREREREDEQAAHCYKRPLSLASAHQAARLASMFAKGLCVNRDYDPVTLSSTVV